MKRFAYACVVPCLVLAGCGSSSSSLSADIESSFATPNANGEISRTDPNRSRAGSEFSSITGNGYGYEVGFVDDQNLEGFAGLVPGATVAPPLSGGTASYQGRFEVAVLGDITRTSDSVGFTSFSDDGVLTLIANFDDQTLTGHGLGRDGGDINPLLDNNELAVDGRFDGNALEGSVTYNGVTGPLLGLVGADEVIGAFHGNSDTQLHAGGFIAN